MTNILLQMENLPWWAYVFFCVGAFCVLLSLNFAVKKFNEYRLEKKRRRLRSFKRPSIDFQIYAVSKFENPPEPMGNQNKSLPPDRNPQPPGISFVFSKEENSEPNVKDVKISENEENEETEIVKLPSTNLEKKTNTKVKGSIEMIKESDCSTSLFKIEDCKNETKLEIENNLQNENIGIKPSPLYIQPSERDNKSEHKFSKKSNIDSESKENRTNKPTKSPTYKNNFDSNINRDDIHGEIFEAKEMDHSFDSKKEQQIKTEIHKKAMKSSPRSDDINEQIIEGSNYTFCTKHNKIDDDKEKEIQQHSETHVIYSSHIFKSEISIMETTNKNQLEDNSKSVVEQKTEKNPQKKQLPLSIKSSEINKNEIDYKTKENGVSNFSTTTFVKYEINNNINVEVSMPQADNLYHGRHLNNKIGDQIDANINTENEFKKIKHNVSTAFSTQNSNCIITNDVTECEQTLETTSLCKDDILLQSKVSASAELFAFSKTEDQGLKEAINFIKPTLNQTKKEDLENRKDRIAHDNIKVHEPLGLSLENKKSQGKQGNSKVDAPSKIINISKDTELFAFSKTEDQGLKEAINFIKPTLNQTKKEDLENRKDRIAHDNIKVHEPLGLSLENKKSQEKQGNSKVDAPSKIINISKDTELFAFSKTEDQGLKEAINFIKPTLNQTKKEDLENRKDRIAHDNIKVHEPVGLSLENKKSQEKQGNSKVDAPSKIINISEDTELFAFSKTEDQGLKEAINFIKPTLNQTKKEDLENREDRIAHDNIKVHEPLGLSLENKKSQEKQGNSKVDAPSKIINISKDTELFAFSKTEDQGLKEAINFIKPTLNQTKKEDLENRKDRIAHDNIKVHEPVGLSLENKKSQEKQGNSKVDAPSKIINISEDTELFAFSKTEDQGLKEAINFIKPTLNQTKKEDLENREDRIAHDNIKVHEPLGLNLENKKSQEKQGNSKVDAPSKIINISKDTELFAFSKTEDQGLKEAINFIKPTLNQTKKEDLENRKDRIAHDNIKVHEPVGLSLENKKSQEKQGNSKVDAPSKIINISEDTELFAFSKTEDQGLKEAINFIKPTLNQTKKEDLENREDRIAHDNIKVHEPLGLSLENKKSQEKQGNSKVDAPSKIINISKDTELFAFSKTEDQGLKEAINFIKPTLNQTKKEDLENRKDRIAHDNIKVHEPVGLSLENKKSQEKQGNSKVDAPSKIINISKDTELFAFSKTEDQGLKEAINFIKPTLNQTKKEDLENRKDRIAHDNIKVHEPLGLSLENQKSQEKQGNSKVDAPSKIINISKDTKQEDAISNTSDKTHDASTSITGLKNHKIG